MNKIIYAIHPGEVKSRYDADIHFVSALELIRLYGVRPDMCVVARDGWEKGYHPDFIRTHFVHLYPRTHGDYTLPEALSSSDADGDDNPTQPDDRIKELKE